MPSIQEMLKEREEKRAAQKAALKKAAREQIREGFDDAQLVSRAERYTKKLRRRSAS